MTISSISVSQNARRRSSRLFYTRAMHVPRPPSIDHGIISFLWAAFLGLFIWLGLVAVGVSNATAFILGVVAGFGIFLFVRLYGEDEIRRPGRRGGAS